MRTKGVSLAKGPVGIIGAVLLAGGILGLLMGSTDFTTAAPDGDVNGGTFLGIEGNGWTWLLFAGAGVLLLISATDALEREDDRDDRRRSRWAPPAVIAIVDGTTCSASSPPTADDAGVRRRRGGAADRRDAAARRPSSARTSWSRTTATHRNGRFEREAARRGARGDDDDGPARVTRGGA